MTYNTPPERKAHGEAGWRNTKSRGVKGTGPRQNTNNKHIITNAQVCKVSIITIIITIIIITITTITIIIINIILW